jgi:hypothetical protein
MKLKPLISLGAAPTTAKKQAKARAEPVRRNIPMILVVGLDFGTAYTKCIVRDLNYRRATPLAFNVNGGETFFLPSEVEWHSGRLRHPLDGFAGDGAHALTYLKMALTAAARGERSDALNAIMRAIGTSDSRQQRTQIQALVVFYLLGVLRAVHRLIAEKWKDFGRNRADAIFYNMAVPVAHARQQAVESAFRECLSATVTLARREQPIPSSLSTMVALVDKNCGIEVAECDLLPEVTANVQSYVKSRGGRQGLYLFADVGAGTVDFSAFIYFIRGADRALTYLYAAVEHLGSSQLEFRTFQRAQATLTQQLRLVKEGATREAKWQMDLAKELKLTGSELRLDITDATERAIAITRPKLRKWQFQQMQILYGGGGCTYDPYELAIAAGFKPRWGLTPISQPLPVPNDVDWPAGRGAALFKRFSVAYGLSFLPTDAPIQRFPDEIGKLPRTRKQEAATVNYAPSKDDV